MLNLERITRQQLGLAEALVLIAGIAAGLAVFRDTIVWRPADDAQTWSIVAVAVLSGLSLAGGPLLILARFRYPRRWRSGALNWFTLSITCWALTPGVVLGAPYPLSPSPAEGCEIGFLPVMATFIFLASSVSGRPTRRWWACRGWWLDWFGMWLTLGWTVVGVYVLAAMYLDIFEYAFH